MGAGSVIICFCLREGELLRLFSFVTSWVRCSAQPKVLCIPWGTAGKPYLLTVALGKSLRVQKNLRVQGRYKLQAIPYNLKS